jgi:hypothetical protein
MSKDFKLFPGLDQPCRFQGGEALCVGILGGPRRVVEELTE